MKAENYREKDDLNWEVHTKTKLSTLFKLFIYSYLMISSLSWNILPTKLEACSKTPSRERETNNLWLMIVRAYRWFLLVVERFSF